MARLVPFSPVIKWDRRMNGEGREAMPSLGILSCYSVRRGNPLSQADLFRQYCEVGRRVGLDVFVFSPRDIDWHRRRIAGYVWEGGRWRQTPVPFPDLVMDRCRCLGTEEMRRTRVALRTLRRHGVRLLGVALPGKWPVYRRLVGTPAVRWLPETVLYTGWASVESLLARHGCVVIKPSVGTAGAGLLLIDRDGGRLRIRGRTMRNGVFYRLFSRARDAAVFLDRWTEGRRFVVQQGIDLLMEGGRVADVRAFVQKNASGAWELVAAGGRVGPRGSATSNLHGGGRGVPLAVLLEPLDAPVRARVRAELRELALTVARTVEAAFGPLFELGLDVGIDRAGRLWLLEVNSKPGRALFARIGDRAGARAVVENPIRYAARLCRQ